ncbi:MAG: type II/IV secretion system protein [Candidatus Rokubacteria bacterium]|nr:type II/IV secretion system protein [Candidatus Rokubacteria bacterium]
MSETVAALCRPVLGNGQRVRPPEGEGSPSQARSARVEVAEPVIETVDHLIRQGLADGASDIHIEPHADRLLVRARVDGFLVRARELPLALHAAIVSRIKIMASLDIAERRVPQDGYIRIRASGAEAYLRVSTLPSRHGEKVVLRLFEPGRGLLALEQLGLSDAQLAVVATMLGHSHGMILVTGPTGCGKTTTLRACIHRLRAEHLNIISVEDPIEYEIPGITQVQIHERVGLTFAETLRAILRQDPNIIMLGEIRDAETAEVAVRASLTGHLLLSTMHTNDAASAILRLVNLGIDPYLIAASTIGVIAQRLVRLVCTGCRVPAAVPAPLLAEFPRLREAAGALVRGRGCAACRHTGYLGRTGIYELLVLDRETRGLLGRETGGTRFHEAVRAAELPTLFDDGLRKVALGLTTLEEVLRVTTAPMASTARSTGALNPGAPR